MYLLINDVFIYQCLRSNVSDVNPPDSVLKKTNPEVGLCTIVYASGRHGGCLTTIDSASAYSLSVYIYIKSDFSVHVKVSISIVCATRSVLNSSRVVMTRTSPTTCWLVSSASER